MTLSSLTDAEATHKKRLAQILHYISKMHQVGADDVDRLSFVREHASGKTLAYFQGIEDRILFTTNDFRRITKHTAELGGTPPFSFYSSNRTTIATTADANKRKTYKTTNKLEANMSFNNNRPCWLRLTRFTSQRTKPSTKSAAVEEYLQQWNLISRINSSKILTLEQLATAPKPPPSMSQNQQTEIKNFLRQYKTYLKRAAMKQELEPLYNRLFDCLQEARENDDLVWGFGNGMQQLEDGRIVNGPLLEVLVEVELARDGALLVRPRQHAGVHLNAEVMTALTRSTDVITSWHRTVSEIETYEFAPGEPHTYSKLLRGLAVELSPDGCFVSAADVYNNVDPKKLVVTDDWCVFHRPKPGTVWARDASKMAENVMAQPASSLPMAAWSLTHGPAVMDLLSRSKGRANNFHDVWISMKSIFAGSTAKHSDLPIKPLLPLPTSETQTQISMLLARGVPAVVCEGPPGSGKSQTIANIVCDYLSQGKRVLVTSKGAPALSVLRHRLPPCVRELCVDVSMSESQGMRQLQQTVEHLADRISGLNNDVHKERCLVLQRKIDTLEGEVRSIDTKLEVQAHHRTRFVHSEEGQKVMNISISMMNEVPWMLEAARKISVEEAHEIAERADMMFVDSSDIIERVSGFSCPVSGNLITLVASKAGETLSSLNTSVSQFIAKVPGIGNLLGLTTRCAKLTELVGSLLLDGKSPVSKSDWEIVCSALRREHEIDNFIRTTLEPLITTNGWAVDKVMRNNGGRRRIDKEFIVWMKKLSELKELVWNYELFDTCKVAAEAMQLDLRRTQVASQLQQLSTELVEATMMTQLSRMFDVEAQRQLIRFSQIAARSKFGKSAQLSKLSQRQRRHRQEYLDAFERCVRYIPCWILTSSQISDYLPAEFDLFDLVVLDEASQSDVTALPGILRGKQWLIVGDGKQVSPTEAFISEVSIVNLRAAVPESPFDESLLPGCSFFDLCSQAYPQGRAVLREHFRCAPEIIAFSNSQFYNNRLVPLRLPTSQERLSPSLVDIEVEGVKVGKINEKECDKIIEMIRDQVSRDDASGHPRSIGVISLIGDDQSRLIRGRLLDVIGPQKMNEHNILVGEPPSFQGAERDIVFLSLVCSPGSVPSQTQLMHAQRANVALSRARDRLVLVRSINTNHVSNNQDIKIPIIGFFAQLHNEDIEDTTMDEPNSTGMFERQVSALFRSALAQENFGHRSMGKIWNKGISVESPHSGSRAAAIIEGAGESLGEWKSMFQQQRSIERVGWKTLRVDALSFLLDHQITMQWVKDFLVSVGIEAPMLAVKKVGLDDAAPVFNDDDASDVVIIDPMEVSFSEVVVISSDDEGKTWGSPDPLGVPVKTEDDDCMDSSKFGNVVDLTFLRTGAQDDMDANEVVMAVRRPADRLTDDDPYLGDQSDMEGNPRPRKRQKGRGYKRLDNYSRDGRFVPGLFQLEDDDWFYDTESETIGKAKGTKMTK